jgi:hypothetical protein
MTPDESRRLLEQLLAEAWFDPGCPEPVIAWEVFKEWAHRRVDAEREEFVVALGYSAEEGLAYLEWCRTFDDPREGWYGDIFLRFCTSRPDAPRLAPAAEYSDASGSLAEFFTRVEELPGFRMALTYPHWELAADGD